MKILAITQARTQSTRLPGKVLMPVGDKTLLELHLNRVTKSRLIDHFIVATTNNPADDRLVALSKRNGLEVFRGSEQDVLDRYYLAAMKFKPEYIVRVTSDCPLLDPVLLDQIIDFAINRNDDYVSNSVNRTFPDGQDVEIMKFESLARAWRLATDDTDREHVTPFIWRNSNLRGGYLFSASSYNHETDLSAIRLTVDYAQDVNVVGRLIGLLGTDASWQQYTECFLKLYPHGYT